MEQQITATDQRQITSQTMEVLSERFLTFADLHNPQTVKTYSYGIKRLLSYLAANNITMPTRQDIIAYKASMIDEGLKPASINLYLAGARVFFQWLTDEGLIQSNPADRVKGDKISQDHKRDYFTIVQMRDVMQTTVGDSLKALRDRAIIALMATTGLRCIEVSRANNCDVQQCGNQTVLYIQGKGRTEKNEYVILTNTILEAITAYKGGNIPDDDAPLFQTLKSNARDGGARLTRIAISVIAKDHFKAAGIDDARHTAHSLRHTAATLNLKAGGTLAETQMLLRHTNINTTMIYQHAIERENNQSEQRIANLLFGCT